MRDLRRWWECDQRFCTVQSGECRKSNVERTPKYEIRRSRVIQRWYFEFRISSFLRHLAFVIRKLTDCPPQIGAAVNRQVAGSEAQRIALQSTWKPGDSRAGSKTRIGISRVVVSYWRHLQDRRRRVAVDEPASKRLIGQSRARQSHPRCSWPCLPS